jgi:hypothetical protein
MHPNEVLAWREIDLINAGDFEALDDLYTDDLIVHYPGHNPLAGSPPFIRAFSRLPLAAGAYDGRREARTFPLRRPVSQPLVTRPSRKPAGRRSSRPRTGGGSPGAPREHPHDLVHLADHDALVRRPLRGLHRVHLDESVPPRRV